MRHLAGSRLAAAMMCWQIHLPHSSQGSAAEGPPTAQSPLGHSPLAWSWLNQLQCGLYGVYMSEVIRIILYI